MVSDNNTSSKVLPDLVIGPDGTAHAVWMDHRTGGGDIYYASLAPSASVWSANVKVSDDPGSARQGDVQIGVDGAGNMLLAWMDDRNPSTELRYSMRPVGGSWQPSQVIPTGGIVFLTPSLAMLPDGRALLAWPEHRGSWDIYASEWDPALGEWSPEERIDDDPGGATQRSPAVALSDNYALLAYMDTRRDLGDIRAQYR